MVPSEGCKLDRSRHRSARHVQGLRGETQRLRLNCHNVPAYTNKGLSAMPRVHGFKSDIDGDFTFCKGRQRDPFNGKSVRKRESTLYSLHFKYSNPALEIKENSCDCRGDAACITAVDLCGGLDFTDGVAVLNRRGAWDALSVLAEHQISVCKTKASNYFGGKSVYCHYELPIIGHSHSCPGGEVSRVCYQDNCRLRDGEASTVTYKLSLPPSRVPDQVAAYRMAKNTFPCYFCYLRKKNCICRRLSRQLLRRNAVEEMNMYKQ